MNIQKLQDEYKRTGRGWMRATFGSIVRRHYEEISKMDPAEKRAFLKELGVPPTYYTELAKELKTIEYDELRVKHGL